VYGSIGRACFRDFPILQQTCNEVLLSAECVLTFQSQIKENMVKTDFLSKIDIIFMEIEKYFHNVDEQ
jgi:hypothetical protein